MYLSKTKDKEQMKILEPATGLKQRQKLSVKLDTNKYFNKDTKNKNTKNKDTKNKNTKNKDTKNKDNKKKYNK